MDMTLETAPRLPYPYRLAEPNGSPFRVYSATDVVDMWMAHCNGDDDYDNEFILVTPDEHEARLTDNDIVVGMLRMIKISEISSILLFPPKK